MQLTRPFNLDDFCSKVSKQHGSKRTCKNPATQRRMFPLSLTHREIHNNTICVRCINACSPTPHTWSCPALWCHAEVPLDDDSLHLLNWRLRRRLDTTGPEQLQHDGLGLLRRVADRTKLKLHSLNYVRTYIHPGEYPTIHRTGVRCCEDNPHNKMGTVPQVTCPYEYRYSIQGDRVI